MKIVSNLLAQIFKNLRQIYDTIMNSQDKSFLKIKYGGEIIFIAKVHLNTLVKQIQSFIGYQRLPFYQEVENKSAIRGSRK